MNISSYESHLFKFSVWFVVMILVSVVFRQQRSHQTSQTIISQAWKWNQKDWRNIVSVPANVGYGLWLLLS